MSKYILHTFYKSSKVSPMIVQVNVRMKNEMYKRLKRDAVEHGVSMEDYACHCFSRFLNQPISDRRNIFSRAKKKTVGRKIKL